MINELEALFMKLREHGLRITLKKCAFVRKEVEYLGFTISEAEYKTSTQVS
jgi:hypothetical protein